VRQFHALGRLPSLPRLSAQLRPSPVRKRCGSARLSLYRLLSSRKDRVRLGIAINPPQATSANQVHTSGAALLPGPNLQQKSHQRHIPLPPPVNRTSQRTSDYSHVLYFSVKDNSARSVVGKPERVLRVACIGQAMTEAFLPESQLSVLPPNS
jgi:hypothetical protein